MMKKLFRISLITLLTGLVFKFFHIHFNGLLLTLGGLLLIIHSIIHLIKYAKSNLILSLNYLIFTLITVYLITRIQYWSFARIVFPVTVLLSIIWLIIFLNKRVKFKFSHLLLILYFAFFLIISYTPSYRILYFVSLNKVLHSNHRKTDYYSWDKYSWFLYLRNKQTEAIEANEYAKKALEESLKNKDPEAIRYKDRIELHEKLIKEKTWVDFK
ncbi:MAG: hypothetical protein JXB49_12910 [Bacteroidales bacterium]|nr:hypothetical protein [Bacteroidales bacterium]